MQAGPGGYLYSVMPIYEQAIGTNAQKQTTGNSSLVLSDVSKIITNLATKEEFEDWYATEL